MERFPAGDFRRYVATIHPKEVSGRELLVRPNRDFMIVRGEHVVFGKGPEEELSNGIVLASENAEVSFSSWSVIVAGGNLKVDYLMPSMVLCDGDVEVSHLVGHSFIIARGKVTHPNGPLSRCLVRSENFLVYPNGKKIEIKGATSDPLAFVKFFELADVGLAAEDLPWREKSNAEGVRLKEVRKVSPFAAGLRSGDVVTAIEEQKTPTTEIFRRLLRRKLAQGGPVLTFTVQRSGKTMDVRLPVKD